MLSSRRQMLIWCRHRSWRSPSQTAPGLIVDFGPRLTGALGDGAWEGGKVVVAKRTQYIIGERILVARALLALLAVAVALPTVLEPNLNLQIRGAVKRGRSQ